MPRTQAPKPPDGPIAKKLKGKPAKQRARLKALEFRKLPRQHSFVRGDFIIEITSLSSFGDSISMNIQATKNGQNVLLSNPFIFHNPPVKVPDGTYHIAQDERGEDFEVSNFKEDVDEALKQLVYETIKVPR